MSIYFILLFVSLTLCGCPSRLVRPVAPYTSTFHRDLPHVRLTLARVQTLGEALENEWTALSELRTDIRDSRSPLTIDRFALFVTAIEFAERFAVTHDESDRRYMQYFCELSNTLRDVHPAFQRLWDVNQEDIAAIFTTRSAAIRAFETLIAFVWHPDVPVPIRVRVHWILQHSLTLVAYRPMQSLAIGSEVMMPLVTIGHNILWSRERHTGDIIDASNGLQNVYRSLIEIVREEPHEQ